MFGRFWEGENSITLVQKTSNYKNSKEEILVKEFFSIRCKNANKSKIEFMILDKKQF